MKECPIVWPYLILDQYIIATGFSNLFIINNSKLHHIYIEMNSMVELLLWIYRKIAELGVNKYIALLIRW